MTLFSFKSSKVFYNIYFFLSLKKCSHLSMSETPQIKEDVPISLCTYVSRNKKKRDCYDDHTLNITSQSLRLHERSLMTQYIAVLQNQFTIIRL